MPSDEYVFAERPGAGTDAATLFLFHGTGGDENQFLDLGADLVSGARRVAVRGDVSESGALRYFKRLAEGRFDMPDLERATVKMSAFLRAHATGPTLAFGYSNGANIVASVLFRSPDAIDRAVLLHPLIPFVPAPQPGLKGKRILITAGERDPICPPAATAALEQWFKDQGADVSTHWHAGGHEIQRSELLAARDLLSAA